jgi:hypothetical protein
MWYLSNTLKAAVQLGEPVVLRNVIPEDRLFDWNLAVRLIDENGQENADLPEKNKYPESGGFVVHGIENHDRMQYWAALSHEIFKEYGGRNKSVHMYGSLCKNSKTFGIHRDTADVLYIGIIGKVLWEVYEERGETKHLMTMESTTQDPILSETICPGDVIYIPRGVWHNTIALKNRVGLSIGREWYKMPWEEDEEDNTD